MLGYWWGDVKYTGPGMSCPSLSSMEGQRQPPSFSWESYIQHTWEWEEEMSGPKYGGRDGYSQA